MNKSLAVDDGFWWRWSLDLGEWIPIPARKALGRRVAIKQFCAGDEAARPEAMEILRKWEKRHKREKGLLVREPRRKLRSTSADNEHENYIGAVSKLVFRVAERREEDLCQAFRAVLPLFAKRTVPPRDFGIPHVVEVDGDPYNVETLIEHLVSHGDDPEAKTLAEHGTDTADVLDCLPNIAVDEDFAPCATLREAARDLWSMLASRALSETPEVVKEFAYGAWLSKNAPVGRVLVESDGLIKAVPFIQGTGYLHALATAAKMLAVKYRWSEDGAVGLLLSWNAYPTVRIARVDYDVRRPSTGLTRINLSIDPMVTAQEVEKLFGAACADLNRSGNQRLSELRLALASHVYSQTHTTPPKGRGREWASLMKSWNERAVAGRVPNAEKGGRSIYRDVGQFRRDAQEARRRILRPTTEAPERNVEYPPLQDFEAQPRRAKKPRSKNP